MSSSARPLSCLAQLPDLKVQFLTRLARLTGIPVGGRKSVLSTRLAETLAQPKLLTADIDARKRVLGDSKDDRTANVHRVLSIDMGIRNLAYCRLLVKRDHFNGSTNGGFEDDALSETSTLGSISVERWSRFPLSSKKPAVASSDVEAVGEEAPQELFTPPVLAKHALSLLNGLVLHAPDGPPDTILIERQRWRSGGRSAIQEWTLRVNSVEAMLWSGLEVLKDQGIWTGSVHAVDPGAVARFWLGEAKKPSKEEPKQDVEGKKGKMAVARHWIETGTIGQPRNGGEVDIDIGLKSGHEHERPDSRLFWEKGAQAMKDAFVFVKDPTNKKLMQVDGQNLRKKDDLADSLLQGVAWVKWEQNRRAIVRDHAVLDLTFPADSTQDSQARGLDNGSLRGEEKLALPLLPSNTKRMKSATKKPGRTTRKTKGKKEDMLDDVDGA